MTARYPCVTATLALALLVQAPLGGRQSSDAAAIVAFQRAADSYAFQHRQIERRGAPPARLVEGTFFTPVVAAAFRDRIRKSGCPALPARDSSVPRANASVEGTSPLPPCLSNVLPALPPELEYRAAGVALLLADAHLHVVVDILHAAFP